ncbi:MAG: GFA family protein [Alphaproteobacteria bacterium]|nr:GFA family protein [Alphaproteobacteria bacterium]
MAHSYEGACLCGGVSFRVQPPSLFCAHCHCTYCQAAHGAAFVTWVGVAEERFELDDPEGRLVWHQSSEQSRRGFCSHCGTTLFFASTMAPGEIHVARALIQGEIDLAPQANAFHDQRVHWVNIEGDLTTFDSTGPELERYRVIKARD